MAEAVEPDGVCAFVYGPRFQVVHYCSSYVMPLEKGIYAQAMEDKTWRERENPVSFLVFFVSFIVYCICRNQYPVVPSRVHLTFANIWWYDCAVRVGIIPLEYHVTFHFLDCFLVHGRNHVCFWGACLSEVKVSYRCLQSVCSFWVKNVKTADLSERANVKLRRFFTALFIRWTFFTIFFLYVF